MDIAKYIGLFLAKNRFCYLPNLGEFKVEKKSAVYKDGVMQAPEYNVVFNFTGGVIDDEFPNFVANNERVSIASAANAIREFANETKKTLAEGGEVLLPGYGKFVNINGKNEFVTDPNVKIEAPAIPIFKINTEATRSTMPGASIPEIHEQMNLKEPSSQEEVVIKPPTVNWGKVLTLVGIIIVILGLIGAGFWYFNQQNKHEVVKAEEPIPVEAPAAPTLDSTQAVKDSTATNASSTVPSGKSAFGILNYADKASAEKKVAQLKSFGHDVTVKENSDNTFTVVITIPAVANVESAKDSLRRFFNPKGTVIEIK
ncbi:MAG TPA: hypothetical protein PKX92_06865 [Edaphocola sp.]|nr:hypothetical protein [Edaphocola sp.]